MLRSRRVALWALWAVAASLLQIAAATTSTTPAASTLSKNMKKLLERVDPNEMADGVARFVFCSSHHYKGLVSGVTPFLVEWSSCTNRHPTDSTEGHIACFLRSTNIISFGINLGQQINNFMGCLLSSNSSSVLCSKKVQKVEDCSNMCPDSRYPNMEAASISSPALSVTVRKDDCKLSPRLASNATLSSLNASLDYSMKLIQCFPIHFGDTYQQMMNHVKVINQCTASRAENWGAWAQCLYDEHDVKLVAPYFVKVRLTIACIVGGDVPAQTFCVRSMKSAEDCRSCGGQDSANILDPVSALGATNTCSV